MKELKLYLKQIENTVIMRVLYQENIKDSLSEHIRVLESPDFCHDHICLRGKNKKYDHDTICITFNTKKDAAAYLEKIIGWLDDVFSVVHEPKYGEKAKFLDMDFFAKEKWEIGIFLFKNKDNDIYYVPMEEEEEFLASRPFNTKHACRMEAIFQSRYDEKSNQYYGFIKE